MGDGGVACMPLHRIMERFSTGDKPCSINNGGGNCILSSKSLKLANNRMSMNSVTGLEKGEVVVDGRRRTAGAGEVEKNDVGEYKVRNEEVEEGEFGTLKCSKDELKIVEAMVQNLGSSKDTKTELLPKKTREEEVQNSEFDAGGCDQLDVENGEIVAENAIIHDYEKLDNGLGRCSLRGAEKGKFVADSWKKWEVEKDYFFEKTPSYDAGTKEKKEWNCEPERTPPSGKCSRQVKDFSRNGSAKLSSSRLDTLQEKNHRLSSKFGDCEGSFINGKNSEREHLSGNRLKRHVTDSEGSDRKHHSDFGDYIGSKSRRISDDSIRPVHSPHHSRHSVERSYRNFSSTRSHHSRRSFKSVVERHCRSPVHSEWSVDRARYHGYRDRSPSYRDKSPYDRSRHYDRRNRSPDHVGRSPKDRVRHHDCINHTPNYIVGSPRGVSKFDDTRESSRKSEAGDKRNNRINERDEEDKLNGRYSTRRIARDSLDRVRDVNVSIDNIADSKSHNHLSSQSPILDCKVPTQIIEPTSMEEDMDICNTPPHVSVMADSTAGKWFYLDYLGVEQGPYKLCDLKKLVEEGVIVSDHLIKHADSYKWLTVENAVSPLVTVSFPAPVSDSVTQLVNLPEPSDNLLMEEAEDLGQPSDLPGKEKSFSAFLPLFGPDSNSAAFSPLEDLCIDERVKALLNGFNILQGNELEAIGEALQISFDHVIDCGENPEGSFWHLSSALGLSDQGTNCPSNVSESTQREAAEFSSDAYTGNTFSSARGEFSDWFSNLWSCKGGDWKRSDETLQDKCYRKKLVLNDAYPLCQMPKSGYEDPRRYRKDELYQPNPSKRLDLPSWAFSFSEEDNECNVIDKSSQVNSAPVRGTKGMVQPVIRINACVKVRMKERSGSLLPSADFKRPPVEDSSALMIDNKQHLKADTKWPTLINRRKDHIYRVGDLQLQLGDWYYLDGAGHEHGPFQFSELQVMVDQGLILKNSSVFRKFDNVWIPINSAAISDFLDPHLRLSTENDGNNMVTNMYHNLHPQFIGYTRGKLHELVMKSYKSREFAAAVNEVLDPWISAKQPKKEMEKHILNSAIYKRSDSEVLSANGARILVNGSDDHCEMKQVSVFLKNDFTFDDLCGKEFFHNEKCDEMEVGKWGLLNGHLLARIFHFLRSDIKSMLFASLTCKHWRAASMFYKDICRHVDLSSVGFNCTDSMVQNILNGYRKENVTSMALIGCNNITSSAVEEIIASFPHLTSMDIRGCLHFNDLALKFPNLSWVMNGSGGLIDIEDPQCKIRSLKQLAEETSSVAKSYACLDNQTDDFSELKDYFDSVDKRDAANKSFRGSLYKRSKLYDARKSLSILSRDARIRRWAIKKSDNGYEKIEDFLSLGLKSIMKENTYDFFISKVAEIERRMRSGYYVAHGLKSVKKDIGAMCKDAMKAKRPGDDEVINYIIKSFIQLATHLDDNLKSCHERDEMIKMWKSDFTAALSSPPSKYKKKHHKRSSDRKYNSKGGCTSINGGSDPREFVSDKEVRRCLSKLNKKSRRDSESEISDGLIGSSDDSRSDSEKNASDTNSEMNSRSEGASGEFRRDGYIIGDKDLDSVMSVDREWGARMTKESLVPPVTRKYEVIDHYVIVADEEDVLRKMKVSLPENYAEKVSVQKHGNQESDMGIPEVKDFKPRKELGKEVIEQEVYGIDPYTHNLLLDSMPDDLEWPLLEKHLFIEDVLLRTLNKQVRNFTGTGNTPKMYLLRPVVEEIQKIADKDSDMRIIKICHSILKSMDNRPDDNYVAYRKGLGVVCNEDNGFSEDDFVVEFLGEVYPAWKWFEKQDGIRSLQEYEDTASEFYNINLERPKGDADGYDLVVVDAMHKANFASRICHSCRPNCQAKVTAVGGQYQIGIYCVRPIHYGEEITFDYNSVTESKKEYEVSVCLCGNHVCRGSYLNLTGEGGFQKVLKESHGVLNRLQLMLEACEINSVSEEDYIDLGEAGLGICLLGGLPDWVVAYSARLVRYINFERLKLPEGILRNNMEERHRYFANLSVQDEKTDAEVQAEGVYLQRLQNLALTLEKVRYVMRCVFGDAKRAPPPLERLCPEAMVLLLWEGEGSLVEQLLRCMAPHIEVNELKAKIHARHPLHSQDTRTELQRSLLWLRDELRNLPCTNKCRHDAAADLIHIYAYTKSFFRLQEYETVTSAAIQITALDLGPKYGDKLSEGGVEYRKTYGPNYCAGQLMNWYSQTNVDPDQTLASDGRGCLYLPDIASFYDDEVEKPGSRHRVYGQRTVRSMLAKMEKQAQRAWAEDMIWSFKRAPVVFGSPMLDAVLTNSPLDKGMVHWLKSRPVIFEAWDP